MKREKSCGAVVFTEVEGKIKYIIIRSKRGLCGFPKGHVESGESEKATAGREVKEETSLNVTFVKGFRMADSYMLPKTRSMKDVIYFLGYYKDQEYKPQKKELSGIELLSYEEALKRLVFKNAKDILIAADNFIKDNSSAVEEAMAVSKKYSN